MDNKNYCRYFIATSMLLSSLVAFASTSNTGAEPALLSLLKTGHATLQLGGYWSYQGKAQHINIEGLIGDTFTVTHHTGSNGLVGFGYFMDGFKRDAVQMLWGVNAFYLAKTSVTGEVVQENLFTNLAYNYSLQHFPVYVMAKGLINTRIPNHTLVVDAGIGPNFMKTNNFSERSLDAITLPDHIFSGQSNTTFSTTASVALRATHVIGIAPIEIGYRFFYLGEGKFNKLSNQVVNTLKTGNAYGNALFCSITI
jgi:hypothetical protein